MFNPVSSYLSQSLGSRQLALEPWLVAYDSLLDMRRKLSNVPGKAECFQGLAAVVRGHVLAGEPRNAISVPNFRFDLSSSLILQNLLQKRLTWLCRCFYQDDDRDAGASDDDDARDARNSTAAGFVPLGNSMDPLDADRSRIREVW